jgi:hypothetical protein
VQRSETHHLRTLRTSRVLSASASHTLLPLMQARFLVRPRNDNASCRGPTPRRPPRLCVRSRLTPAKNSCGIPILHMPQSFRPSVSSRPFSGRPARGNNYNSRTREWKESLWYFPCLSRNVPANSAYRHSGEGKTREYFPQSWDPRRWGKMVHAIHHLPAASSERPLIIDRRRRTRLRFAHRLPASK